MEVHLKQITFYPKTTELQPETSDIALATTLSSSNMCSNKNSVNTVKVDEYPKKNIDNIILDNSYENRTELNSNEKLKSEFIVFPEMQKGSAKLKIEVIDKKIVQCKKQQIVTPLGHEIDDSFESEINPLNTNSKDNENVLFKTNKRIRERPKHQKNNDAICSNTEFAKRPAKVSRGQRKFTRNVKKTKKRSKSITVKELLPDLDKAKKKQLRGNCALQRQKMDIKHSENFYKNGKQKIKMSSSIHTFLESVEGVKTRKRTSLNNGQQVDIEHRNNRSVRKCLFSKFDVSSSENSSNQPVVDSSQEPKQKVNLKQCIVPVLYPLEQVKPGEQISLDIGSSKIYVIKGPDSASPFKILKTISTMPAKSSTDITTSPILADTPTRNQELLRDTSKISPIRNLNFNHISFADKVNTVQTNKDVIITNEFLKPEPRTSRVKLEFEPEKVRQDYPHPVKVYPGKKNSLQLKDCSVQMMDLISAKTTLLSSIKPKEPKVFDSYISPMKNRILKMIVQLKKSDHQEHINEEVQTDQIKGTLKFSESVPSPFGALSCGILKKRKISKGADETVIRPCKRRRVYFSDPLVSSVKFIEKNTSYKCSSSIKLDPVAQEPRVTRSSKGSDEKIEETTDFPNVVTTVYTPKIQNGDYQKSCEASVVTNNNENSVENSETLLSEPLPNAQDFLHDVPSTSRATSESVLKWSPKVNHSILNEEVLDETIRTVILTIVDIIDEKKLEAQPLLKLLLDDHNNNILIKDKVRFIAKKFNENPIEILKHFDSNSVCHSLLELASKSESSEIIQISLSEMFNSIINNPKDFVLFLSKIKMVELIGFVISQMETSDDISEFLKQIYDSVPCELYLKPVPKELLPKEELKEKTNDEIVQNFIVPTIENGNLSEESLTSVFNSVMKKFECNKIYSLFHKEIQRRCINKLCL